MSGSYANDLFSEPARSWDILEQQRYRLSERIEALSAAELNARPLDIIADDLCQRYSLDVPVLHEEAATASQEELDLDLGRRFILGQPRIVRGLRVTIAVPFTGDRRLFDLRPDTYEDLRAPKGMVVGNAVVFAIEGARLTAEEVRADYDVWLELVRRNLEAHRARLGGFNEQLRLFVTTGINERIERLREHADLISRLGLQTAA